jgi:hypothetical protein
MEGSTEQMQGAPTSAETQLVAFIKQPIIAVSLSTFGLYLVAVIYLDAYVSYFSANLAWFQPGPLTLLTFTWAALAFAAIVACIYFFVAMSVNHWLWRALYWLWVSVVVFLNYFAANADVVRGDYSAGWAHIFTMSLYMILPMLLRYLTQTDEERSRQLETLEQELLKLDKPREEWTEEETELSKKIVASFYELKAKILRRRKWVNRFPDLPRHRLGAIKVVLNCGFFFFALVSFSRQFAEVSAYMNVTSQQYWTSTGNGSQTTAEKILFSDGTRVLMATRRSDSSYFITYRDQAQNKTYTREFQ